MFLQAILSRKLVVPEMEEVLKKVAKLSVNGSNAMIRIHCRQVLTHEKKLHVSSLPDTECQKYFKSNSICVLLSVL